MTSLNQKKKTCICANCDFRDEIFSPLDDQFIENLCKNKEEHLFRKSEIINHEGEEIYTVNYLKSGLVKLYRGTTIGEEQVLTITKPFEFVSNISIFSEQRYQYSVSALEDCACCMIKIDFIKDMFFKNGAFAMRLLNKISMINDKIITQILNIYYRNLNGRVAYVLLYFTKDIYNSRVFNLPISREEFAKYIGMSNANVIRTLTSFNREGIIRINGKIIEVVDINQLEVISKLGRFR